MPSEVAYDTSTALDTSPDSSTTKLTASPSFASAASTDTFTVPVSSIVAVALEAVVDTSASPAVLAPVSFSTSVSSGSSTWSVFVAMSIVLLATPAPIVNCVPLGAV